LRFGRLALLMGGKRLRLYQRKTEGRRKKDMGKTGIRGKNPAGQEGK
jgi:hypothetical protein